jgi:hypothetical protein
MAYRVVQIVVAALALVVSLTTLLVLAWQARLLRTAMETSNYQDLIGKVLEQRDILIGNPDVAHLF